MCETGPGLRSNVGTAGAASDTADGSAAANRLMSGIPLNYRRRVNSAFGILSGQDAEGAAALRLVKVFFRTAEGEQTSGPASSRSNYTPDPTRPPATVLPGPVPGRGPASFCFTDA